MGYSGMTCKCMVVVRKEGAGGMVWQLGIMPIYMCVSILREQVVVSAWHKA